MTAPRFACLLVGALGACSAPAAEIAVVTLAAPVSPTPEPVVSAAKATPPPSARPAAPEPAEEAPVEWTDRGPAPKGMLRLGKATAVPELADLATVLIALRPRLLRCAEHAPKADAGAATPLVLEVRIGASGEVLSAKVQRAPGVPADLTTCLEAQMSSARFAPPQGGAATLTLPLNVSAR